METIRRDLDLKLRGKKIRDIATDNPKMFTPNFNSVRRKVKGREIKKIERRAKMLIMGLNGGIFLLFHLKMTGQLVYVRQAKITAGGHPITGERDLPNKFTHAIFYFNDKSILYFNDVRKFGYIKLVDGKGSEKIEAGIGIEPLEKEFTLKKFIELVKKYPRGKIKQVLMRQELIAGIGNIYSDEICFFAKVKPARTVASLSAADFKKLFQGIKKILQSAIKNRGTSFNTYVDARGEKGNFVPLLKVYGRAGAKCRRGDGGVIKKIKLGGRSSCFCPVCQK